MFLFANRQSIFSNLEKLMGMCFAQKVPVLILPIPDSAFLQHNHEARERRDAVTQMLKDKTANLTRHGFIFVPFTQPVFILRPRHRTNGDILHC